MRAISAQARRLLATALLLASPLLGGAQQQQAGGEAEPDWGRAWSAIPGSIQRPVRIEGTATRRWRYTFQQRGGQLGAEMVELPHSRGYRGEKLLVTRAGPLRYRFEGEESTPGPDDGPVRRPVVYDLMFISGHLAGTRQVGQGKARAVLLGPVDRQD